MIRRKRLSVVLALAATMLLVLPALAQIEGLDNQFNVRKSGGIQGQLTLTAQFTKATADEAARLFITAEIPEGWHTYSVTQKSGGPIRTKIKLEKSDQYRLLDAGFKVTPAPTVTFQEAWKNLPVEHHEGRVTWHAPIELAPGMDVGQLRITGVVNAQRCDANGCIPPADFAFTAELGRGVELPAEVRTSPPSAPLSDAPKGETMYQAKGSSVVVRGRVEPSVAVPGSRVRLTLGAEVPDGYHVYALGSTVDAKKPFRPTLIVLSDKPEWARSAPSANAAPSEHPGLTASGERYVQRQHEGGAEWTIEFEVPRDAPSGEYPLTGWFGYQTCSRTCEFPQAVRFAATLQVAEVEVDAASPVHFVTAKYNEVARLAAGEPAVEPSVDSSRGPDEGAATALPSESSRGPVDAPTLNEEALRRHVAAKNAEDASSLPAMLAFGFLGGLILNLMPCVLPVIGLKVMSFVQQSGQERGQVLLLNIWYSVGLMSVFMVLAALAHTAGLGWGGLFRYPSFNIVLAAIVFVMGLSFLGVWEIPIPGFVGSGKAGELATREGPAGAFFKGMLTTVLATPCTGPFLGTALVFAVRQPPHVIYLMFACVGLGMASPYLILGAFPALVRFLPRPGAWMETFKQIMGFVLFGTVVYLFTIIPSTYLVPTIALLTGLGAACWWIGRTPLTAALEQRLLAWFGATTFACLIGLLAFGWLDEIMAGRLEDDTERLVIARLAGEGPKQGANHAAWEPYSWQKLESLTRQRRTVLVDFTANWCLICQVLEAQVLNTEGTRRIVADNGIVMLKADWTDHSDDVETDRMMKILGREQVPVLAIFPADRPNQPIIVDEPYTNADLAKLLKQAGPSRDAGPQTAGRVRETHQ